jgi:hypothetical protein
MLMQKTVEIAEVKSSEARTLAAARADDGTRVAVPDVVEAETGDAGANQSGVGQSSAASDPGCRLQ